MSLEAAITVSLLAWPIVGAGVHEHADCAGYCFAITREPAGCVASW
jgi:hypothetical protein